MCSSRCEWWPSECAGGRQRLSRIRQASREMGFFDGVSAAAKGALARVVPPTAASETPGGLIEPPVAEAQQLNVIEFVLYKHSLTSVCFRRSKDAFSLRERLFILVFVLMQTMSVATQADLWIHQDGGERTWRTSAATLALTIFVVTPVTILVK